MRNRGDFDQRVEAQGGVISVSQAQALGVPRMALHRLLRKGWRRMLPGIYAAPGVPDFVAQLRAALLWGAPEAVASHRAAGTLYELWRVPKKVEITIPLDRRLEHYRLKVHRSDLPAEDRATHRGFPVTSPARTLFDLAPHLGFVDLASAVESGWNKGLIVPAELAARNIHGRRGMDDLARILSDCQQRTRPMDSPLEVWLWHTILGSSLPRPRPQFELFDAEGHLVRIDFAFPEQRVAVEAKGFDDHTTKPAFEHDARRESCLAAIHWRLIYVTWHELQVNAKYVIQRIAQSLDPAPAYEALG